jgi:signal transduction histidine kinase
MKERPLPSMMRRLVFNQLAVIVIFAVLAFANLVWHMYSPNSGEVDRFLEGQAKSLLQLLKPLQHDPEQMVRVMENTTHFSRDFTARLKTEKPALETEFEMAFRLLDASGRVVFTSAGHTGLPWHELKDGGQDLQHNTAHWRAVSVTSSDGALSVQIAESLDVIDEMISAEVLRYIVLPLLAFLPVAGLMTAWATRRGLAPLRELASTIAHRSPDDLQPLGPVRAHIETQPVVSEINLLLAKLQATLSNQRDFLADAAHELRTPLAVIQAQAHVLQTAASETDRNAAAEELNIGVSRAASLIGKLLLTARVSSEAFKPRMEVLDIAAFTQERVALLSALAVQKQIDMELNTEPNILVRVDRETFVSAVDNVIDNAIRYTPARGRIQIDIDSPSPTQVRMRVADDGPGIPPELHERVFERFFRVHSSEQQGSGLGLAIVRRVLNLHGGQVHLSPGIGSRGLAVVLTLPLGLR